MKIAQELYEGIDVDGSGPVGLITYMRTDSLRVSEDALDGVRELIESELRREVPARKAQPLRRRQDGAGGPRGGPADRPDARSRGDPGQAHPRPVPALLPDLPTLRRQPDDPGASSRSPTSRSGPARGCSSAQGKILRFDGYRRVLPPAGKQEDQLLPALPRTRRWTSTTWPRPSTSPSRRPATARPP